MLNSKHIPGLILTLLVLGILAFSLNRWGRSALMTADGDESPVSQPSSDHQAISTVPEEFIDDTLDESATQDFATQPTAEIWQTLLSGLQNGKKVQASLEKALILRLRKEPGNAIYDELLLLFKEGTLDAVSQQTLLSILGEVGNYKAAETLMRLVNAGILHDPDIKLTAFHAISKFSPESWSSNPNTEIAPVFEAAWQVQQDEEFLSAIANVMASIGTPSTLNIFLQTLTDGTDQERVEAAKEAMTYAVNPVWIPKLTEALTTSSVENVQIASAGALASMGKLDAAVELLKWSTNANSGQVESLIRPSFEIALNTTPEFIDYLDTSLAKQQFASPEVKQTIEEVLGVVKSGVE